MKYDRQIALSVANTRKSTSWQPWNTTIAEFYEKLNLIEKKSDSGDAQYVKGIL